KGDGKRGGVGLVAIERDLTAERLRQRVRDVQAEAGAVPSACGAGFLKAGEQRRVAFGTDARAAVANRHRDPLAVGGGATGDGTAGGCVLGRGVGQIGEAAFGGERGDPSRGGGGGGGAPGRAPFV